MAERYDDPPRDANVGGANGSGDDGSYEWIGEWLCEYVDGTMDPSMQAVFEEYMEANPELADHVERLCRTRLLLSECECREEAAERVKSRLHRAKQAGRLEEASREIEEQVREAMATNASASPQPPGKGPSREDSSREDSSREARRSSVLSSKTRTVAAVASAMTLMLGVGMVAGAAFFADGSRTLPVPAMTQEPADRASDRSPAPPHRLPGNRTSSGNRASSSGRMTFGGAQAADSWTAPPLPLKKMPVRAGDSAHASHAPLRHTVLSP